MSTTRFVTSDGLPEFLDFLSRDDRCVLVPVEKPAVKRSIVFEPWQRGLAITFDKATVPPKEAVLPQCECLVKYKKTKDSANPESVALSLDDTNNAIPTVVFGCRPCDARGFAVLDNPYLNGPFADPYYKAKRDSLVVITKTCPKASNTCFCHWVGCGPSATEGSDILMTSVEGGLVLEAVSQKGEEILSASSLPDGADRMEEANVARKVAEQSLGKLEDLSEAKAKIAARFTDVAFWEKSTDRCLSCGACTYFCPTCYCFSITDEGEALSENGGRRLRSWDNCMSSLFTREASGHNPRTSKALRMRNRISHKFSTYPENWGAFSCNGCGRCIANCPVCLDIRAIVLGAISSTSDQKPD